MVNGSQNYTVQYWLRHYESKGILRAFEISVPAYNSADSESGWGRCVAGASFLGILIAYHNLLGVSIDPTAPFKMY